MRRVRKKSQQFTINNFIIFTSCFHNIWHSDIRFTKKVLANVLLRSVPTKSTVRSILSIWLLCMQLM